MVTNTNSRRKKYPARPKGGSFAKLRKQLMRDPVKKDW